LAMSAKGTREERRVPGERGVARERVVVREERRVPGERDVARERVVVRDEGGEACAWREGCGA
jgi:hypothetical protein